MNKESINLLKELLACAWGTATEELKNAEIADTYNPNRGLTTEVKKKLKLIRDTYIELEKYEL